MTIITPEVLLNAYAAGIFPMAESADDQSLFWIDPEFRGILPLDGFHVPRRLKRTVRSAKFDVRIDTSFDAVVSGCADSTPSRPSTWINQRIRHLYQQLFEMDRCHTVEVWREGKLVGGLYGINLGGAFFGESMFSRESDASKVALVHLVARLKTGGFTLLDTQFITDHLSRFGVLEISREEYHGILQTALTVQADFDAFRGDGDPDYVLQSISQTS